MVDPQLKVIFFDLGSVLIHVDEDNAITQLCELTGKSLEQIKKDFDAKRSLFDAFNKGELGRHEFYQNMSRGYHLSFQQFYDVYTSIFHLNESVLSIAKQLAPRYRLSIISNTDELHYERICNDYLDLSLFENPITSFQAGALKPDAKIYQYALQQLEISAESSLLIDDKTENVQGAQAMGMNALHFTSADQLIYDLNQLGINL